jgi:hypothetical protein
MGTAAKWLIVATIPGMVSIPGLLSIPSIAAATDEITLQRAGVTNVVDVDTAVWRSCGTARSSRQETNPNCRRRET